MGLLGFRAFLAKHFPQVIKSAPCTEHSCERVFIEGNYLLHQFGYSGHTRNTSLLPNFDDTTARKLHSLDAPRFAQRMQRKCEEIRTRDLRASHGATLVFDGCGPFAKMYSQHLHRLSVRATLRVPASVPLSLSLTHTQRHLSNAGHRNVITPGCEFMDQFVTHLQQLVHNSATQFANNSATQFVHNNVDHKNINQFMHNNVDHFLHENTDKSLLKNAQLRISSVREPNEGETKIFQGIKHLLLTPGSKGVSNFAIHGSDSDLILLGIGSESLHRFCRDVNVTLFVPHERSHSAYDAIELHSFHSHFSTQFSNQLVRLDFLLLLLMQLEDYGPPISDDMCVWPQYLELYKQHERTMILKFEPMCPMLELDVPLLCSVHNVHKTNIEKVTQFHIDHVLDYCNYLTWLLHMFVCDGQVLDMRYIFPYGSAPLLQTMLAVYNHLVRMMHRIDSHSLRMGFFV